MKTQTDLPEQARKHKARAIRLALQRNDKGFIKYIPRNAKSPKEYVYIPIDSIYNWIEDEGYGE